MSKDFNINSKDFFNIENKSKKYIVSICDNLSKINLMIKYFNDFIKITSSDNKFISIDFEFNRSNDNTKREIALFQINLETNKNGRIFLFYPPDLNKNQINILKKLLLTKNIKKIIHGGESLDIPYLFSNIFISNEEQIMFCHDLFDTKYLCEYYNNKNNKIDYKCKIYYLLKQMNVINEKQFDYLLENEEKMGPIYNIKIKINKMNKELINYCTYDVLYLSELYKKFPDDIYYQKIIPEITTIHFVLKQTDFFKINYETISKYNNYFFKINDSTLKLIDFYEFMYYWIIDDNLESLLQITYFKKFFQITLKFIVYSLVINNYEIYINKNLLNETTLDHKDFFSKINFFKDSSLIFNNLYFKIKKQIYI